MYYLQYFAHNRTTEYGSSRTPTIRRRFSRPIPFSSRLIPSADRINFPVPPNNERGRTGEGRTQIGHRRHRPRRPFIMGKYFPGENECRSRRRNSIAETRYRRTRTDDATLSLQKTSPTSSEIRSDDSVCVWTRTTPVCGASCRRPLTSASPLSRDSCIIIAFNEKLEE